MMEASERRSSVRRPEQGAVFIEVLASTDEDGKQEKILVCNTIEVSSGGLRVQLDEPIEKNAVLQLAVKLGKLDASMLLVGEVRWCAPSPDGRGYQAGFAFLESEGTDLETWRALVQAIHYG